MDNRAHACCNASVRSLYKVGFLRSAVRRGLHLAWPVAGLNIDAERGGAIQLGTDVSGAAALTSRAASERSGTARDRNPPPKPPQSAISTKPPHTALQSAISSSPPHRSPQSARSSLLEGVAGAEALTRGSGGSTLLAALSACRHVTVYGSGLLRLPTTRAGLPPQLVYSHFYDESVARCTTEREVLRFAQRQGLCSKSTCKAARAGWLHDRLSSELLLHVMHALGLITWRQ